MYQFVYVSNPTVAFDDHQLTSMLSSARASNQQNGVTGALLFSGKTFVQCIEGPRECIQRLAKSISSDTRHKNLIVLHEGEIAERSFPKWFMGCARVGESELLKLAEAEWTVAAANAPSSTKTTGQELLLEFWAIFREE